MFRRRFSKFHLFLQIQPVLGKHLVKNIVRFTEERRNITEYLQNACLSQRDRSERAIIRNDTRTQYRFILSLRMSGRTASERIAGDEINAAIGPRRAPDFTVLPRIQNRRVSPRGAILLRDSPGG